MAETIISQLDRAFGLPLETNRQVNFISDRDAISALRRWQGMQVFVISEQKTYTLKTGILNTDWVESEAASLTGYTEQGGYEGTAQDIVNSIASTVGNVSQISVVWLQDLDYYVIANPYYINNQIYTAAPTTVTLAVGDATHPRFDVIFADVNGVIDVLVGTPSATPSKPVVDESTQLELTFVRIDALATTPATPVTNELVFDENLQVAGGEWDVWGAYGADLNFASTTVAYSGTKSIYFNGGNPYFIAHFRNDANILVAGLSTLFMRVYVTEVLDVNAGLIFQLLNESFQNTGVAITVKHNLYGFDRNNLNVWQLVAIPIADFRVTIAEIKGIKFTVTTVKKPKFYLDAIKFQYYVEQPVQVINGARWGDITGDLTAQTDLQAALDLKFDDSDALTVVTPSNKLVTENDISSFGGGDMLKSVYDTTDNGIVDDAEKVNGLTVETAVPAGAVFTDTIYNDSDVLKDADALTAVSPTNKLITQTDVAGLGGGDMLKSVYDPTNVNGDTFATDLMKNTTVEKVTPIDADNLTLWDSVSSSFKKVTWANIKATLKTYFDTLYTKNFPDLTNKLDDYAWAMSDVETALVSGDTSPVYATFPFTLNGFFVSVGTAPTGASIVINLKKNGTTVLSTQAQIEVSEFTSLTGVAPVVSVSSFVKGDKITPEIVQVGSTVAGADLKIYLDITRI